MAVLSETLVVSGSRTQHNPGSPVDNQLVIPAIIASAWTIVLYHFTGSNQVEFEVDLSGASSFNQLSPVDYRQLRISRSCTPLDLIKIMMSLFQGAVNLRVCANIGNEQLGAVQQQTLLRFGPSQQPVADEEAGSEKYKCDERVVLDTSEYHGHWRSKLSGEPPQPLQLDGLTESLRRVVTEFLRKPTSDIFKCDVTGSYQLSHGQILPYDDPDSTTFDGARLEASILETCKRFPQKDAVSSWDGTMTFAELARAVTTLSTKIIGHGYAPESRIILAVNASKWAIVAWLGVLKSGNVSVLVDHDAPRARIEEIARQTEAEMIICDEHRVSRFRGIECDLTTPRQLMNRVCGAESLISSWVVPNSDDGGEAMIVFTSGSTGRPKGVVQTHHGILRGLWRFAEALQLGYASRMLQFASLSFDVSIGEIFTTLLVGGCVCIPESSTKLSDLEQNIAAFGVTEAILTPTVASQMHLDKIPTLRQLCVGGEPVSTQLRQALAAKIPVVNVVYGATEGAIWDSIVRVYHDEPNDGNIGYPIGGRLWVVHPHDPNHLSPTGVLGEICIQGPDIACRYLGMPDLTSKRFQASLPWVKKTRGHPASLTVFRTGDLGVFLQDGSIKLVGRVDRQVKIRGQRLELGEVQACIEEMIPRGSRVHVDTLRTGQDLRLVAYLTVENPDHQDIAHMEKLAREAVGSLPSYMAPSLYIPLKSFPLTSSKKIDCQELKRIGSGKLEELSVQSVLDGKTASPSEESGHLSTFDEARQKVLAYVKVAKGIETDPVGVDFGFSHLGFDSVDAAALSNALHSVLGVKLPVHYFMGSEASMSSLVNLCYQRQSQTSEMPRSSLSDELEHWKAKVDLFSTASGHSQVGEARGQQSPEEAKAKSSMGNVLLTGATGFLGLEILRQILEEHQSSVTVIVRGDSEAAARVRIIELAENSNWWKTTYYDRIHVLLGDISAHQLGLSDQDWASIFGNSTLVRATDTIIHCGAVVHWAHDFNALSRANIGSTYQILQELSRAPHPPRFLFISGGYISPEEETEEQLIKTLSRMPAYDQTKFVSEQIIAHFCNMFAADRSLHVATIKPGFIIGSARDGVCREGDTIWRLVKACARISSFSDLDYYSWLPVAGVDQIARAILQTAVHLGLDTLSTGKQPIKILRGLPLSRFWGMIRDHGIDVHPLEHLRWKKALADDMSDQGPAHPLYPLSDWVSKEEGCLGGPTPSRLEDEPETEAAVAQSIAYVFTRPEATST